MQKHTFLLTTALLTTTSFLHYASAADSTVINIKANIVASSCAVETDTLNIDLGDVDVRELSTGGKKSPWSDIKNIVINDCPAGVTSVKATFSGTPGLSTSSFKSRGTARNVAVYLADDNPTETILQNGTTLELPVASGGVIFPVRACLYAEGIATVGTVVSTVNVAFEYK